MNFKLPETFYFKADSGDSAVLLLHGFTGNTSDDIVLDKLRRPCRASKEDY